ncbi:MAG: biliverdin-producing heme oxygenase [Desulfomonilaceae bacterium]
MQRRIIPISSQFMQALREAIAPFHDEAENAGPLSAIPAKTISLEEYRKILERLYGFVFIAENVVEPLVKHSGLDYGKRIRVDHLVKDLRFLGNASESFNELSICQDMPVIKNTAQGLGLLYLFEGSRLGGLVLSKVLKEHFGLKNYRGYSYFASNGAEVTTMWASFKNFMENFVCIKGGGDEIIATSKESFALFNKWLAGS